jgi:hypothetical protein
MSGWGGKSNVEMGGCTLRLPQPLIEQARALGERTVDSQRRRHARAPG